MNCLARNKTTIYYATLSEKTELTDEYGNKTGQYELTYAAPVEWAANCRWDSGAVQLEGFGLNQSGTRRIVTCDMDCPITESSILWIGITPTVDEQTGEVTPAHNYVVAGAPERSLNQLAILVQEVNVS
jgi:hypothetical protein